MRFRWTGVAERRARQVPVAALAVASASATRAQAGRAAFTAAGAVLGERGPGAGRASQPPSPASPALQLASCLSPLDHAPNSGDNAFTEDSGQWGASALLTPAACSRPPCRLRPPPPGQVAVPTSQAVDSLCGLPLRETAFGPGALRTIRVPRRQTRLGLREAGVVATPGRLRLRQRESGGRGPSGWSHNTQVHTWLRHGPDAGTQLAARGDTPRRSASPPGPAPRGALQSVSPLQGAETNPTPGAERSDRNWAPRCSEGCKREPLTRPVCLPGLVLVCKAKATIGRHVSSKGPNFRQFR